MWVIYKNPQIGSEFPEIWLIDSHILPKGAYEFLPARSVFLDRSGLNSAQKIPIKSYWAIFSFMKICVIRATLYLREYMKIYPSFDIFPAIWVKFRIGYVENNLLSHCEFPEKWLSQSNACTVLDAQMNLNLYFEHSFSVSSFANRCTFIKTLITIYIKIRWLLHVSFYDHHQGACNWVWLKLYWY